MIEPGLHVAGDRPEGRRSIQVERTLAELRTPAAFVRQAVDNQLRLAGCPDQLMQRLVVVEPYARGDVLLAVLDWSDAGVDARSGPQVARSREQVLVRRQESMEVLELGI